MEPTRQEAPRKLSIVRLFVLLVVIVALVVLGWAMFFHQSTTDITPPADTANTSQSQSASPVDASSANKSGSGTPNQSASVPAGSSSSTPTAANSANQNSSNVANQPPQPSQSSQLSNTGPGNVVALFVGVIALGALVHTFIRRSTREIR